MKHAELLVLLVWLAICVHNLVRSQTVVDCNDSTTPRSPDIDTCPEGTPGYAGVPGLISTSTVRSCFGYDGVLDCGPSDNITLIEVGIPPSGGQTTSFSINVAHSTGSSGPGENSTASSCDARQNGECIVFSRMRLEITTSPLYIVYDLKDTNQDTFYAYSSFHASHFENQGPDASSACGTFETNLGTSKLQSDIFDDTINYNAACWPWKLQEERITEAGPGGGTFLNTRSEYYTTRPTYDCILPQISDKPSGHKAYGTSDDKDSTPTSQRTSLSKAIRSEFCRSPFPNLDTQRYGLKSAREPEKYRWETQDEFQKLTRSTDVDAGLPYNYPEHSELAVSNSTRCRIKYSHLSNRSPCAQWAGTFYDQLPLPRNYIHVPSDAQFDTSDDDDDALPSDFEIFYESRPVIPGCPGPFYGNQRYLLPRRPDASSRVSEGKLSEALPNTARLPTSNLPYPTLGQCTPTDSTCCDAEVFTQDPNTNDDLYYPFSNCIGVRSKTETSCRARYGSKRKAPKDNSDGILTNTDGMGRIYPQCRAWDISSQPRGLFSLTARLIDEVTGEEVYSVTTKNYGSLNNNAQEASDSSSTTVAVSQSREMSVQILNLDTTTRKLAQNINGYIVVCNASQSSQMFEGCGDDGLDNPWDSIGVDGIENIPRRNGGYTQFPTDPTDKENEPLLRRPCVNAENNNDHAWWYYTARKNDFGDTCGKLGINPLFFADLANQRQVCTAPINTCVPGFAPLTNGARDRWTYEDRLMDHWNTTFEAQGSRTEDRYVRERISVLTPCQQSGKMIQLEEMSKCSDFVSAIDSNQDWPLPPGWVEFDGNEEQCRKPRYHVHGSRLVYSGSRTSSGSNYIRAEISIVGTVLNAATSISPGRFATNEELGYAPDEATNTCGLVLDSNDGLLTTNVINTGLQAGDYRLRVDCALGLIVGGVGDITLGAGEIGEVRVPVQDSGTNEELRNARLALCTAVLTHPTFSDIVFATANVSCAAIGADVVPSFSPDAVECANTATADCARSFFLDDDNDVNTKSTAIVAIVMWSLFAAAFIGSILSCVYINKIVKSDFKGINAKIDSQRAFVG